MTDPQTKTEATDDNQGGVLNIKASNRFAFTLHAGEKLSDVASRIAEKTNISKTYNQVASNYPKISDNKYVKKLMDKLGIAGGVISSAIEAAGGGNQTDIMAAAVPLGGSIVEATRGNEIEGVLQALEETGAGSFLTEVARPVLQAMGVENVESGLLQDILYDTGEVLEEIALLNMSTEEIALYQDGLLQEQDSSFPSHINQIPFVTAMRNPEIREKFKAHLLANGDSDALHVLDQFDTLQIALQEKQNIEKQYISPEGEETQIVLNTPSNTAEALTIG